jgi:hypothetical protein
MYPLYINRYVRIVRYCYKICNVENLIIKTIVESSIADGEMNKSNWFYYVKCMLARYGFLETWYNFRNINIANFISTFNHRLIDKFVQDCKGVMERSSSLLVIKLLVLKIRLLLDNI